MKEDNISMRDMTGRPIETGASWIIYVIRGIILLITFPIRAIFYILNPFAAKNVRIKK